MHPQSKYRQEANHHWCTCVCNAIHSININIFFIVINHFTYTKFVLLWFFSSPRIADIFIVHRILPVSNFQLKAKEPITLKLALWIKLVRLLNNCQNTDNLLELIKLRLVLQLRGFCTKKLGIYREQIVIGILCNNMKSIK